MKNNKKTVSSEVEKQEKKKVSRRGFLKKAAYSAPVLMVMERLAKPENAYADGSESRQSAPAGHPNWSVN